MIDHHWKVLLGMDHLRDGIGTRLRAKDPLISSTKREMTCYSRHDTRTHPSRMCWAHMFRVQAVRGEQPPPVPADPATRRWCSTAA